MVSSRAGRLTQKEGAGDETFRVAVVHLDSTVLVSVSGVIDVQTAPNVELALRSAVAGGGGKVVMDVSKVSLFGSDAIRAVLRASKAAHAAGVSLRMVGITPLMRRVLQATAMDTVFGLDDSPR